MGYEYQKEQGEVNGIFGRKKRNGKILWNYIRMSKIEEKSAFIQ